MLSVVSFCTTSTITSPTVYLDSKGDFILTNKTCFCEVEKQKNVTFTAIYLDYPHQVKISYDNVSFEAPFQNYPQSVNIEQKHAYVRYDTYEKAGNLVCLQFEGKAFVFLVFRYK